MAAIFGVLLGAPTLRLRGDYLAIVTLGFGEIVPNFFRNAAGITGGIRGINPSWRSDLPEIMGFRINFGATDAAQLVLADGLSSGCFRSS